MFGVLGDLALACFCYVYVLSLVFISNRLPNYLPVSKKTARKILHVMMGNIVFVLPFFTFYIVPILISGSITVLNFLGSPYSPLKNVNKSLSEITEEGHSLGLVFYALSYTVLTALFISNPVVIMVGMMPMAYGDAAASVVGEKIGQTKYKLFAKKSVEGSVAMFVASLVSLAVGFLVFACFGFAFSSWLFVPIIAVAATVVEGLSPLGLDNLTVPATCVLTFLLLSGVM